MAFNSKLQENYIAVIGGQSSIGIATNNGNLTFGNISVMSSLVEGLSVGNSVMFDINNAFQVTYDSQEYFLIKSTDIILIEVE